MNSVTRITEPDRIKNYLSDESAAFAGSADELFLPATEAEVVEIVRAANVARKRLTISAAGTGITGARVPMGGAVLSVERMTAAERNTADGFELACSSEYSILLNRDGKRAIVPPAITLAALDGILARHGLLYPPDPTEMTAMMAGTVATNASGARSFHYGPTRDWVRRLRIVLPTGEVLDITRGTYFARNGRITLDAGGRKIEIALPDAATYRMPQTKNAAGLYLAPQMDAIDLFIGCEGLLGVVTEIEIALTERIHKTLTVVSFFTSRDHALDFVDEGSRPDAPLEFLSLEYFDHRSLDFMRAKYPDIPNNVSAAVLFEIAYGGGDDLNPYPPSDLIARLRERLAKHGAHVDWAVPSSRREDIRLFRHALPEAVNEFVRKRAGKIGSDMAVPHARFREMMDIYEREASASGIPFVMFGHIGDDHLHLNFLPETKDEAGRAKLAYTKLANAAVRLGGTISAEHGVGKKTIFDEQGRSVPYLQALYGVAGLREIARIKKLLDPNCILNIGNMVPAEMLG